jgi:diguanylate cyclase (GGDEF)-like protein
MLRLDQARMLLEQSGKLDLAESVTSVEMLQALIDGLCDLSQRDALTGLANRRYFGSVLDREIDRVARSGESALLLMVDIDFFKKINDAHGHPAGDAVIRMVAQRLSQCVRPMDTVARYGGEEFAVVLPDCPAHFAEILTERIRTSIEREPMVLASGVEIWATISLGGAFAPGWIRSSSSLWIERADLQLYSAKTQGRNRAHLEQTPVSTVSAEEKTLLFGHMGDEFLEYLDAESSGPGLAQG